MNKTQKFKIINPDVSNFEFIISKIVSYFGFRYSDLQHSEPFGCETSKLISPQLGSKASKLGGMGVFVFFFLLTFLFSLSTGVAHAATIKTPTTSGLVDYWPMNEGVGIRTDDISGIKNNGVLQSSPVWINGKIGKALNFNGSSNYVSLTRAPFSGTSFTISGWIKLSALQDKKFIAAIDVNPSIETKGIAFGVNTTAFNGINANSILLQAGRDGWAWSVWSSPTNSLTQINQWYHVAVTITGADTASPTVTFYINGASQSATSWSSGVGAVNYGTNMDASSRIGGAYTASSPGYDTHYFNGSTDDIRVYNRALSAAEVRNIYQSGAVATKTSFSSGLMGYWPLNGDYGDYSGRKNDFTVLGTCLSNSTDAVTGGISTTGWATCGSAPQKLGYLRVGNVLNSSSELTLIAWVKGDGILWSGVPTFWFIADSNGAHLDKYTGSWVTVATGTGGGTSSQWRQLVVTKTSYDGIKIYSNTVEIASSTAQTFYTPTVHTVGRYEVYDDSGYHFTGNIDDVRMYNRILSKTEINELYKMRPATQNSISSTFLNNGLVGLWSFDGKDMNWNTNTATDRSGQGNTGTLVSMSTSSSPTIGKIGQGLKFNGSNSIVDFGTKFPSITTAVSVSVWVNPGSTQMLYADIWGNHQGDHRGLVMQQNAGTTNQYSWGYGNGSGWGNTTGFFNLSTNVWTHVVAVKDSSNCYVYLNGIEQVGVRGSCPDNIVPATTMNFSAGLGYAGGDRYFNGKIDDVRIYNRALSASEVKQLYNSGR